MNCEWFDRVLLYKRVVKNKKCKIRSTSNSSTYHLMYRSDICGIVFHFVYQVCCILQYFKESNV